MDTVKSIERKIIDIGMGYKEVIKIISLGILGKAWVLNMFSVL